MTSIFQVLTDFHWPPCGGLSAVVNIYGLFERIMSVTDIKDAVIFFNKYLFLPLHTNEKRLAPREVQKVPFFGFSFFFVENL